MGLSSDISWRENNIAAYRNELAAWGQVEDKVDYYVNTYYSSGGGPAYDCYNWHRCSDTLTPAQVFSDITSGLKEFEKPMFLKQFQIVDSAFQWGMALGGSSWSFYKDSKKATWIWLQNVKSKKYRDIQSYIGTKVRYLNDHIAKSIRGINELKTVAAMLDGYKDKLNGELKTHESQLQREKMLIERDLQNQLDEWEREAQQQASAIRRDAVMLAEYI